MKKRLAALILGFSIMMTPTLGFASMIHESRNVINLSQGVNLTKINSLYENGQQGVNILEIDLKNPSVKIDLLFNQNGFAQRTKLSNMVNQSSGVIAAVNGDFFSMSNPGFSLGPMVKDGKQLSNAHYEQNKYASFMVDVNNSPIMAYINPGVQIENQSRNIKVDISAINKPSKDFGNIVIYTSEYMKNSPGANGTYFDLCEIVVENDIVREVRFGQGPVAIPQNGYVILAGGANSYLLQGAFGVGEKVNILTDISMNHQNVKTAVGGGTMLLRNGQDVPLTQEVKGKSQRTAMGVTSDQRILIVTVDGRKAPYIGMDERDLQQYMKSLGAKDAMMLDGGGSTQMIADGKIQNDMTGSERDLVNALAVKSTAQRGPIASIEINPLKETVFAGDKVELVIRGFDSAKNPILDITTPSYSVGSEGFSGSFDGRNFTFSSAGTGYITASYGGVTGRVEMQVLPKNAPDSRFVQNVQGQSIASVFGDMKASDSVFDDAIRAFMQSAASASQQVIMMDNSDKVFLGGLSAPTEDFSGAYKYKNHAGATFISVDNKNGGVSKVNGQWAYLKGLIDKGEQNVVIFLQGSSTMGTPREQEAFDSMIQNAGKTKNIYIVYKANDFSSRMDGRVSYIGVPDYKNIKKTNLYEDIKYLSFMNQDGKLVYTFQKIFSN